MWTPASNPTTRRLLILGEAPGAEEEKANQPFVGPSGQLLRKELFPAAGLDISQWAITNVFSKRPPNSDLKEWTRNKTEMKKLGLPIVGAPLQKRYLLPEYASMAECARNAVATFRPELVVALGATAQWLLSSDDRIGTFRGAFFQSPFGPALSTFHPASILREYKMLPVAVMDLIKVRMWLEGTLPAPLRRTLVVNPSFAEIEQAYEHFLDRPQEPIGVDIETAPSIAQITTISYSFPDYGLCIPIWDKDAAPGKENFWQTAAEEVQAWRWIDRFAKLPNPKVLQNGMYDMQYLLDAPIDIRLAGTIEDTAIMQHAFQPELRKDLGSLASFYLNEPCWKQMRQSAKDAKADE